MCCISAKIAENILELKLLGENMFKNVLFKLNLNYFVFYFLFCVSYFCLKIPKYNELLESFKVKTETFESTLNASLTHSATLPRSFELKPWLGVQTKLNESHHSI